MDQQRDKIADESERDRNVDAWLSGMAGVSLSKALKFIREEYLISLGSNAKTLSPTEVYGAINDIYKGQLKALHYLGKGFKDEIAKIKSESSET